MRARHRKQTANPHVRFPSDVRLQRVKEISAVTKFEGRFGFTRNFVQVDVKVFGPIAICAAHISVSRVAGTAKSSNEAGAQSFEAFQNDRIRCAKARAHA